MKFGASIVVESQLEAATPVAVKPLTVGAVIAPAVIHGKPIQGKVVISGPPNASFSGLQLSLHTFGSHKPENAGAEWTVVTLGAPVDVPLKLAADKTYTLDAGGKVEVPFSAATKALLPVDSLGADGVVCVQHELEASLTPASTFGSAALRATRPLFVQTLTPTPSVNDTGSWCTVGDFAGECKLVLTNSSTDTWPLGGVIEGEVTIEGTAPLLRAKAILLSSVRGAEPIPVKEVVVWEAKDATLGESPQGKFKVRVPLEGEGLCISVSETSGFSIVHSLRLQLDSADELSGWNTLPVCLCHGPVLKGSPAGSMKKIDKIDAKKLVSRPTPKAKGAWLSRILVFFLLLLLALGVDTGVGVANGQLGYGMKAYQSSVAYAKQVYTELSEAVAAKKEEVDRAKQEKEEGKALKEAKREAKRKLKDIPEKQIREVMTAAAPERAFFLL